MFYFSFLIALLSTLCYINMTIADICNSKSYAYVTDEKFLKKAQRSALFRWISILIMSFFWPMVFIF